MKDLSQSKRMLFFVVYTIFWETFIWSGTMFLIYFMAASPWLLILTLLLGASQFQPRHFGLSVFSKKPEDMDEDEFEQYEKALVLEIKLAQIQNKNDENA